MLRSAKLACYEIACRQSGGRTMRWRVVKALTTVGVVVAILAPREWQIHAALAANVFWIWVDA